MWLTSEMFKDKGHFLASSYISTRLNDASIRFVYFMKSSYPVA